MQSSQASQPRHTINRNGQFEQRIERIRDANKAPMPIERAERHQQTVKVNQLYTKERKEFKNKNLEKLRLCETIFKEALVQRQFYPHIIRQPEKISLKDNKPNIEMKKGRINVNEVVLSRNGQQSFDISKFFHTYTYVECSIEFVQDTYTQPEFDFFVLNSKKMYQTNLDEIFSEDMQDLIGNEANEIRKMFRRLYHQLTFLDTIQLLVTDILPEWTIATEQYKMHFHNPNLKDLVLPPYVQTTIQCNDQKEQRKIAPQHIYFNNIRILNQYKINKSVKIKRMNIYSKEVEVFSDIRYILHPQKTYFIQIMEEVKQAIHTAHDINNDNSFEVEILQQVYELIYSKSQEFLLLICTYIPSSIDLQIRTNKLSEYFWSNFMYMEEIHKVSPQMLQKYNVLASWYAMPQRMFGYKREVIQSSFYELVKTGCQIQRTLNNKIKFSNLIEANLQKVIKKQQKKLTKK